MISLRSHDLAQGGGCGPSILQMRKLKSRKPEELACALTEPRSSRGGQRDPRSEASVVTPGLDWLGARMQQAARTVGAKARGLKTCGQRCVGRGKVAAVVGALG